MLRLALTLTIFVLALPAIAGEFYEGKVVRIVDGDTLVLLVERGQLKIRLSDIDTPERQQPFGTKAKQALSDLAFGKQVSVIELTKDRCGRIIGRIYAGGLEVN